MATQSEAKLTKPIVGPERSLLEVTVKGLILGAVLSMILAAANAYIGLLVGLTVSASIPAAAVSMGVLRLFRRSNILENNLVQTAASAGEALVSGIIYTIPALVMMKAWTNYEFWPIVTIAILGGILGVAFTIPLRRALIIDAKLTFPEGVATAEILKTGGIENDAGKKEENNEQSVKGFKLLLQATGLGAIIELLKSGLGVFAGSISTIQSWFSGKMLFMASINTSPALIGVGYIVGLNVAILLFSGGLIGTIIGVPLNWFLNQENILAATGIAAGTDITDLTNSQWSAIASESWQNCRRIGVGMMIIGGLWSLVSLYRPLVNGVKANLESYRKRNNDANHVTARTEMDTPINYIGIVITLSVIPLFSIFYYVLGDYPDKLFIAIVMTILMLVFGFVFSSVAGYMAGLVGSSNNPISGVTIATVLISSLILLQLMGNNGIAAKLGPIAVIYLAGLICASAGIANDNMQDLKCGHIIGATPWRQQMYQIVGVTAAAFVIPSVLQILDKGRGIGRPVVEGGSFLAAPQAGLMHDISTGVFGSGIAWNFIFIGFVLAIVMILLDKYQEKRGSKFRFPVLAVAIGIYLPLGLSFTIVLGGILSYFVKKKSKSLSSENTQKRENNGLLLASGLITGEALMGVFTAIAAVMLSGNLPSLLPPGVATTLAIFIIIAVSYYLYKKTTDSSNS